jgi:AcrR family transcriptional regulator
MARQLDPAATRALLAAALRLLAERGFARLTMEAVAAEAGVGKPAIYRRFRDKAELVAAALGTALPPMAAPDHGDTRRELRELVERALPTDGVGFVSLAGQLLAEHERHPELIATYRARVLEPRRRVVIDAIRRGQERGDLRGDLDPDVAVDMVTGEFLARVWGGRPTDDRWRAEFFDRWWELVRAH